MAQPNTQITLRSISIPMGELPCAWMGTMGSGLKRMNFIKSHGHHVNRTQSLDGECFPMTADNIKGHWAPNVYHGCCGG